MLDLKFVRENPDIVKQNIKNKLQTYQKARNDIIRIISDHTL